MYKLIVLACVIAVALGAHISKETSKFTTREKLIQRLNTPRKIVGGVEIDIKQTPYQVAIDEDGKFSCGGSIINNNHILTAAHCTMQVYPEDLTVRAGSTTHASGGVLIQVSAIQAHEGFSIFTFDNDVAVLTLAENLVYSDSIQPIALTDVEPSSGDIAAISGWGTVKDGDTVASDNLRYVEVPIVDRETCNNDYDGGITSRMICAGLTEGGKDSCQGDSGGPLVVNGVLAGVVSFGNGCALPGYPGVYANVDNLRDWIESHL